MDPKQEELVRQIAQQVLAVLQERGLADSAARDGGRAEVHPPLGVCTGDYSKFPELAGKLWGGGAEQKATVDSASTGDTGTPTPDSRNEAPVLTGIVTASQLQAAIDASADRTARLAPDARLTPLANDMARQHPEKITRVAAGDKSLRPAAPGDLPWLWWIEGACPVVKELTRELGNRLRPIVEPRTAASLAAVIRDTASALQGGNAAGALLFVPGAARAACLANRCRAIRAIVGTSVETVNQGIAELGVNVLIVEYPQHGPRSIRAMVERMLQQNPKAPAAVQRDLADLHRNG